MHGAKCNIEKPNPSAPYEPAASGTGVSPLETPSVIDSNSSSTESAEGISNSNSAGGSIIPTDKTPIPNTAYNSPTKWQFGTSTYYSADDQNASINPYTPNAQNPKLGNGNCFNTAPEFNINGKVPIGSSSPYYNAYAATNNGGSLFSQSMTNVVNENNKQANCGLCYEVKCVESPYFDGNHKCLSKEGYKVQVVDACPLDVNPICKQATAGKYNHFDVAQPIMTKMTGDPKSNGLITINWRGPVAC